MIIDLNWIPVKGLKEKLPLSKMSISDFDHLKITTMTVIVKLKGKTFIENAFPLLDITRLDLPPTTRSRKKYKIPYCGIPGAILSAKYRNITRGIVKSTSKRSFLNSITLDICTSVKNINAKLSGGKIHMCGPNSENLAIETAQHIIDHLLKLQEDLDWINQDPETRDKTIEWIKKNSVGQDYVIDAETQEIIELGEGERVEGDLIINGDGTTRKKRIQHNFTQWKAGDSVTEKNVVCNENKEPYIVINRGVEEPAIVGHNFFIKSEIDDSGDTTYSFLDPDGNPINYIDTPELRIMRVKSIKIPSEYPASYPDNVDPRIANFYIKYAPDFAYHHVYCQFLDSVKEIEEVATDDLAIDSVDMAMINYSYSLGMCIDRWQLLNNINGRNGFSARYCNSTDHSVTITLPYELPEGSRNRVRRKNKPPRHTFIVHKSGIVTQSGPNVDLIRSAYYRFMATILEIKEAIIQRDRPFSLKYNPVYPDTKTNQKIPNKYITCQ